MVHANDANVYDTRIGPMSLFTLIVVICLAVLAVLTFSTANATYVMTERQATATTELYLDEAAAQEFLAGLSDELETVRRSGEDADSALNAIPDALISLRDRVQASSDGKVNVTASMVDSKVNAEFSCENGRVLSIVVTIRNDTTLRIDKWKMTAVQNEEEPAGNLWTGD